MPRALLLCVGAVHAFSPLLTPTVYRACILKPTQVWCTASPAYSLGNTTALAELLDASFVPAVMGLSRGDVTELKLFIAATKAAYDRRVPIDEVSAEMNELPVQAAGRELAQEEAELRRMWFSLVYMTLEQVTGLQTGDITVLVPDDLLIKHSRLVSNLLEAKRASLPLSQLQLDEIAGSSARSAMEAAVLTQSMKIVYSTVDVIADIEAAGERADAPRPFIPGTER